MTDLLDFSDDAVAFDDPIDARSASDHSTDALEFACSEVWGGNRTVDREVSLPGLRGHLYSHPAQGGRGGDVNYLSVCGSGLLSRLCIADVTGHGEAVAKVGGEMHRFLRRFMNHPDQRRVLVDLNRRLGEPDLNVIATAVAVSYYAPHHSLSLSYAGHPPAWYRESGRGAWRPLVREQPSEQTALADMPLGVTATTQYSRMQRHARPGDRLLLLTDGVLEAPHAGERAGRERRLDLFGPDRLAAVLARTDGQSPERIVHALVGELRAFSDDAELSHDDVTILLVEFTEGPRGPALWHAIRNRIVRPKRQRGLR